MFFGIFLGAVWCTLTPDGLLLCLVSVFHLFLTSRGAFCPAGPPSDQLVRISQKLGGYGTLLPILTSLAITFVLFSNHPAPVQTVVRRVKTLDIFAEKEARTKSMNIHFFETHKNSLHFLGIWEPPFFRCISMIQLQ